MKTQVRVVVSMLFFGMAHVGLQAATGSTEFPTSYSPSVRTANLPNTNTPAPFLALEPTKVEANTSKSLLVYLYGAGGSYVADSKFGSGSGGEPAEDQKNSSLISQPPSQSGQIDGAVVYDYDPSTELGDDVFYTIVCDFERDARGRNSHGGPVCMEYANGDLVAFHTNTSGHNIDGWSEYAVSKDSGRTWNKYNKFRYSHEAYLRDPNSPVWIEEGLVTEKGTVVLFVTHFQCKSKAYSRSKSGVMRSYDHGSTWTDYESVDGNFIGYPCATAVAGAVNYVLFDIFDADGPHVLYASTDDGRTWSKRSTLTLDNSKWYGALCIMADGRLLAGAYETKDENHFYYCISEDNGYTWSEQKRAYVDKKIRDPELAYLAGSYYLHGRSGYIGQGGNRFVLYQSDNGENWKSGVVVSKDAKGPDGYNHNCIINKYKADVAKELMVEYSISYTGHFTNEYVFFVKPETK
ncbi:MAG: glycoside hydrolase [Planctomycetaceae bacterium]|nr:glycoside hydrolase [Planctomycetaceae bacterium]